MSDRTFSTSTDDIAAGAGAAGGGDDAAGAAAGAAAVDGPEEGFEVGATAGCDAVECPNTFDMIDPRTLIGLLCDASRQRTTLSQGVGLSNAFHTNDGQKDPTVLVVRASD